MITNTNNMDMLEVLKDQFGEYNNDKLKEEEEKVKKEKRRNIDLQGNLEEAESNLELTQCKNDVTEKINDYQNQINILAELTELYELKEKNITNYMENIKDNTKKNSRIAYFQFEKIKNQQNLLSFLTIVYYLVFIFWVIFSDYIANKKYFSVNYWLIMITYLVIPLKLQTIVNLFYYLFYNLKKYINIFIYQLQPNSFIYSSI